MPTEPGTPTFDQLRVLVTVVETGSFAGAARKLNRATSVISYAIGNLEAQLGVALFEREATRRPQLTDAGRMVLAEARTIAGGIDDLRSKVRGYLQGLEAELHIVLDVLLPSHRIIDALTAFRQTFSTVALHLHVEAMGAVTKLVLDRVAVVGISGPVASSLDEIARIGVGSVPLVPVAAPEHPLAQAKINPPGAGRDHIQLVLTDRSPLTDGQDFAVLSTRTWRLAELSAKYDLLKAGIGWGNMPLPMVADDLKAGRLKQLVMADVRTVDYAFDAIYRKDTPPGPAARWLIARFQQQPGENAPRSPDAPPPRRRRMDHRPPAKATRTRRTK